MSYDAASNQIVLFGGRSSEGRLLDDTWVYANGTWTEACASNCGPDPATDAAMTYDQQLDQLVMFGGETGTNPVQFTNATWTWNGSQWYRPPTSEQDAPPPRANASFAADDTGSAGGIVLFGGTGTSTLNPASPLSSGPTATLGDTWTWDGSEWSQQRPATSPSPRTGAGAAWDPAIGSVVLFGGSPLATIGGQLADTWTWRGNNWSPVNAPTQPPARADEVVAYQPILGTVVAYGGQTPSGPAGDTWALDAGDWVNISGAGPAARTNAAGTSDSATNSVVVFGGAFPGGALGDTQALSGQPGSAPVPTTAPPPSPLPAPPRPAPTPTSPLPGAPSGGPGAANTAATGPKGANVGSAAAGGGSPPSGLAVTSERVRDGSYVSLSGYGFQPGSRVTLSFHSTPVRVIAFATSDASGDFTTSVIVPRDAPKGWHHFLATGVGKAGGTVTLQSPVYVTSLALAAQTTGNEVLIMLLLAIGIPVLTWMALSIHSRRRAAGSF